MEREVEIWKDIAGYEGYYQVSNDGRIKSIERRINRTTKTGLVHLKFIRERVLQQSFAGPYLKVNLAKSGVNKTTHVHSLVFKAFNDVYNPELDIDHLDEDKTNNKASNLQQITRRKNVSKGFLKHSTSSKYTGVTLINGSNKWKSALRIDGKRINLGLFNTELEAHKAYQNKLNTLK